MIQKIFHITWTIFGIVFITVLVIAGIGIVKLNSAIDGFDENVNSIHLEREDVVKLLDTMKQQVENDEIKYKAQLAQFAPEYFAEHYGND
jgi:hypothetical protein